jgi:flagellar motility protein MotE (MotC chaperone)
MNFGPQIRIFPLMIVVAMMAFSVRLADFASGMSSLSGAAMAAKEAEEADPNVKPPDDQKLAEAGKPALPEKPAAEAAKTEAVKPPENAKAAEAPAEKPAEGEKAEGEKDAAATDKKADPKAVEVPSIDWRDASDEDVEASKDKLGVLDDLSARRDALDKRENELKTREALLKVTEQEIDRKYQELTQMRTEIKNLLDKQTEEEKARITSLVKIYEGMKPKEAARIFDTLDIDVLMSVMSQMSERKLSPIIAAMNPERAKTMTIMLAQEKKLPTLPESN